MAVPRAEAAPPPATTLLSPSGGFSTTSVPFYYTFSQVSASTWYYLWVKNLGTGATVVKKWYDVAHLTCNAGFCYIQSPMSLPIGDYRWWVQTWNSDGDGAWSTPLNFTIMPVPKPSINQPTAGQSTPIEDIIWDKDEAAQQYQVWVNKAGTSTNVWNQWYTLTELACADSLSSFCGIYVPLPAGTYTAWVRGWNSSGNGLWSDSRTFTFTVPGAATLNNPFGATSDTTPTYLWQGVDGATWYYLWVNKGTTAVVKQWFKAEDLMTGGTACVPHTYPCSVTLGTTLSAGNYTWWIRTWGAAGTGEWSAGRNFSIN